MGQLYEGYLAATVQPERLAPVLEELRDRASARAYSARWSNGDLEVVQIRGRRGARELQEVTKGFRGAAHSLALVSCSWPSCPRSSGPSSLHGPAYKRYTPSTITSPVALRRHLLAVRERGIAFDIQRVRQRRLLHRRPSPAAAPATRWWPRWASPSRPGGSRPSSGP